MEPLTLVRLLPVKSAEPPRRSGRAGVIAVRTISDNLREACAGSVALYVGSDFSQPSGSSPEIRRVSSACSLEKALPSESTRKFPSVWTFDPRSPPHAHVKET